MKTNLPIDALSIQLEKLSDLIQTRLISEKEGLNIKKFKLPKKDKSPYATFLRSKKLTVNEHVILLLALIPHIRPDFFYHLLEAHQSKDATLPQMGGVKDESQQYFLPTGETAMFLLAGYNLSKRLEIQKIFSSQHFFAKNGILSLETTRDGNPKFSGKIILDEEYVDLFTMGEANIPSFSMNFPAIEITTKLDHEDLVLNSKTANQIIEINRWLDHKDKLMIDWGMGQKLKPGYSALFYGPSGTGKTLTAGLLGKRKGKELKVFRIDLTMVISKYIGETEKNLKKLFDKAQNKDWILFFDEADSLFGKGKEVKGADDRFANQVVSFFLQKVENYPGLVILSSNFKNNIDDAFIRQFNSIIHFPKPNARERLSLWHKAFPKEVKLAKEIDLESLAKTYELTGANILNVVQYASLIALSKKTNTIDLKHVLAGIKKELKK